MCFIDGYDGHFGNIHSESSRRKHIFGNGLLTTMNKRMNEVEFPQFLEKVMIIAYMYYSSKMNAITPLCVAKLLVFELSFCNHLYLLYL